MSKFTSKLIRKIPKAELHCHLDGSLRPETILRLANKQQIELPTKNLTELKKYFSISNNLKTLEEYIAKFNLTLSVMQTPESLKETSYELAKDCHRDGVRYLEVRYSPILHTKKGMTLTESIENVKLGLNQATNEFKIKCGIIICGIRHISPEVSLKLADLAVQYKNNGVVGFDLAGAEENFPAKHHQSAFDLILKNNINTTLHAGEAYGSESIHQAIHSCGTHRIGHGTHLRDNHDLMQYVNDHRIPLEICLSSNIHTNSISTLKDHPFLYYLNKHLRVTLNTDNRLISNTTLTNEYLTAINQFKLNQNQVYTIIINGFKSAFMPHIEKRSLIKDIVDELETELGFDKNIII